MSDTSDFTFCQVGLQGDGDSLESPKIIPRIGNITINDNPSSLQKNSSSGNSTSKESGTDDSLTFKVIDKLPPKLKVVECLERRDFGDSFLDAQDEKTVTKKPIARQKVPFEKGFSQMDWLKVTRTHSDLAGLRGQSNRRFISLDEVKQHKTGDSIWTVLNGRVYNISPYLKFHPGGVDMLMKAAGKDCTSLFNKYHAWVNAEFLLEKCLVGILDNSQ
ncbi:cytochrome b5 domain-containing protein RLF [Cinnamomum micranthum f. kanehirae]|uniref:Cytochrome b5 domain-containing protein RLF n=1 Tax=Cinnamomum micranthum f. kanehirae TaxID=337451 RepID=A0A3S3Q319_9MAGN|nr:cytochrome b5 domain-containing protein RLF [Cinnamomum micranthum f. kanehirae]